MTFECVVCGKVSTPDKRVAFATEVECMDCLGKAPWDAQMRWLAQQIASESDRMLAIVDKYTPPPQQPARKWWQFWK